MALKINDLDLTAIWVGLSFPEYFYVKPDTTLSERRAEYRTFYPPYYNAPDSIWAPNEPTVNGYSWGCPAMHADGLLYAHNCTDMLPMLTATETVHVFNVYENANTTGRAFMYNSTGATWLDAENACHNEGMYLARIMMPSDLSYLAELSGAPEGTMFWVGMENAHLNYEGTEYEGYGYAPYFVDRASEYYQPNLVVNGVTPETPMLPWIDGTPDNKFGIEGYVLAAVVVTGEFGKTMKFDDVYGGTKLASVCEKSMSHIDVDVINRNARC